ncbi:14528_t:CDS:2, partial [Dentiscutata heterogama]
MAAMINAPDSTLPSALSGRATGATVILAHNVHIDKDWSLARECLNKPLNNDLIETLKQIEIEKNDMLLGKDIYNQPATKTKPKAPFHQGITTEDVDRIKNITKANLQAVAKFLQETISRATKTLDNSKKSANKRVKNTAIIRFL